MPGPARSDQPEAKDNQGGKLLRASEERLALALKASKMGIWELDLQTREVSWSQECLAICGLSGFGSDLASFGSRVYPDDLERVRLVLEEAIVSHQPFVIEYRSLHGDGRWRWLANRGEAQYDSEGAPTCMVGTVQDVTESRLFAEELQTSERRFRQLADSICEVFWLTDTATREVLYVSPGYERIWGRTCESLYQSPDDWLEAIHPTDRGPIEATLKCRGEGAWEEEFRITRPDGEVRWVRSQAFPVHDQQGAIVRIAGIAEDVTKRRELEAQVRHTQKMQSIGELAGGVAHDFNNLLTVISTASDLLDRMLPENPEARELVQEVRSAQQRAASLTRQLLAFARKDVYERRIVDLDASVADTERMLRRLLGEDILLTTKLGAYGKRVRIDPGQLAQVLMNLAVNARDAMPSGGSLHIETAVVVRSSGASEGQPFIKITVADSGLGMDDEVRARVFEPFFTTKDVGEGTGIGLAVVFGAIDQAGGKIELCSVPGHGTTFTILLPAAEADVSATHAQSGTSAGSGETILLVEDEAMVRRLAERGLRLNGYNVISAGNAREAITILGSAQPIHLLLTDIVMPGMDGRQLAAEARVLRPEIRVLYASGYTDEAMIRRGVDRSEVNFLPKPYSLETLARGVREALESDVLPPVVGGSNPAEAVPKRSA